jgi:hypothetical protein
MARIDGQVPETIEGMKKCWRQTAKIAFAPQSAGEAVIRDGETPRYSHHKSPATD